MKPNPCADQDWYLYNVKWNLANDDYLIKRLIEHEEECKPYPPFESPHAIFCAMEALNKEMQANLEYTDVLARVKFLKTRYNCFKKLAARVETDWDVPNNQVTADDKVWEIIFLDDPLTRGYYEKGDPLWSKLCRLFGYNSIKREEASPTVILISDSSHAFVPPSTNKWISLSDDEVTSPVLKPPTSRKLSFDDDAESTVGQPAAKPSHVFLPIERRFLFPPTNAFPKKPETSDAKDKSVEHSSCASSSPHN